MSTQITTAYVQSFKSNVLMLAQQKMSKLRPHVTVEDQMSEIQFYDQVGATYMIEKRQQSAASGVQGRHGASPILSTPHRKRGVKMGDYIVGDAVDNQDNVRTLNDFKNPYVRAFSAASGRQMDYVMVNGSFDAAIGGGIFGTNVIDAGGTGSIAWDDWIAGTGTGDAATAHPDHQIAHGSTGMTLDKWITAKTVLDGADVDDEGGRVLVITEVQLRELLADPQLTSSDYNTIKALVAGEINTYLGMQVVVISSTAYARADASVTAADSLGAGEIAPIVPVDTSGGAGTHFRRCFAFCRNRLLMTIGIDNEANISKRADLNYTWYAHLAASFGSCRLEEKAFVEIQCSVPDVTLP